MPVAKDPARPEFYVYHLVIEGAPFYVGIGRSARASDRVRYVRNLLRREAEGTAVHWNLSAAVIARLLQEGHDVEVVYIRKGLSRAAALGEEKHQIARLLGEGVLLANIQHNPHAPRQPVDVVAPLLARLVSRRKDIAADRAAPKGRVTT